MIKFGSDKARPFTPITTVAAQLVLTVEDSPDAPGDPGDAVRALLYPGELVWGAWDAYVCATSDKVCTPAERAWVPQWGSFASVKYLKGHDRQLTRVFGNKKPQILAGSFFAAAGAVVAAIRGNAGTLGIFSAGAPHFLVRSQLL